MLRDSHALIWSIFGSILPNNLNMFNTVLWGALLVATIVASVCIVDKNDILRTVKSKNTKLLGCANLIGLEL